MGLSNWLSTASADCGYTDDTIESLLPQRIREFERRTQWRIFPVQVVCQPDGTYDNPQTGLDVTGTYEVVEEDPYPYHVQDASEFLSTYLRQRPVIQVQRARLMLDRSTTVLVIPDEWNRIERRSGRYTIMPVSGAAAVIGATTAMAALQMSFANKPYIPHLLCFDYLAGLPVGWEKLREWSDLKRKLEEYCAYAILQDISELYDAGRMRKSVSADGLSQQSEYDRFARRKAELEKSSTEFEQIIRDTETHLMMGFV